MSDAGDERGRVLAVDDNRLNRMTLARSLEQAGHHATLAASGEEALERLEREAFDVVLLDLVMPGMDGFEVLRRIKASAELRDLPVIVISAVEDVGSAVRCIEMGAEDYLPKPFNAVLLRARLGASLRKKRLRDIERAYLEQEMTLRQSERLATLGRLSAGLAHELNNPAAAARRAAAQLSRAAETARAAWRDLGHGGLAAAQLAVVERSVAAGARSGPGAGVGLPGAARTELDPIERADAADAAEDLLADVCGHDAWELAPAWIDAGRTVEELRALLEALPAASLGAAVRAVVSFDAVRDLVGHVVTGTTRVSELVDALKDYSYMDRAPVQRVDVHAGLEATLGMLGSRLGDVTIVRDFAEELPSIDAYGSELNQVWTQLLENAIDALDGDGEGDGQGDGQGGGTIRISTEADAGGVVVRIEDDGPGIAEDLLPRVFDPFVTTKPPGSGTGLGLTTCHAIVVQKHGGSLRVTSEPGRTEVEVRLPREAPGAPSDVGSTDSGRA